MLTDPNCSPLWPRISLRPVELYPPAWKPSGQEAEPEAGLNDFARNGSILIKQIDSTHSMIAVRDDELLTGWVSNEKQRRKFLAGRNSHMIFANVRIGYSQ
jgi:hypothetical protein